MNLQSTSGPRGPAERLALLDVNHMPTKREAPLVQDTTEEVRKAGGRGQQDAETCPTSR